ncbi:hypothetical protein BKA57DRAFT_447499 [Linnemannia elongata]|nr:hypothetical protein BKA57DRAFT_447499 [Linnemannia elongata]
MTSQSLSLFFVLSSLVAYEKRKKKKKRVYDRKTRTESRNERMNDTTTTLSIPTALQVTTDYGKLKKQENKEKDGSDWALLL